MFNKFIEAFNTQALGVLLENEALARHTSFRVGGPARVFVMPKSKDALKTTLALIKENQLPYRIIGRGSNLLPSDHVFEGVVIKCDKGLNHIEVNDTQVTVGAGVSTILLANQLAKANLAGLEFLSGVPGSMGGAVFMNAGAYNREIKDILIKALIIDETGEFVWKENHEFEFGYRTSNMQKHREWILVEVVLELEAGNTDEILELMKNRKERRLESQPTNYPSAGSTFRNPLPRFSWQLIDEAGLRGHRIGGAEVSLKHSNFVVNVDHATAQDIYDLIHYVQAVVLEHSGVLLHPEVELFNW